MSAFLQHDLATLLQQYGYLAVALAVAIESLGIPFPGETTLIFAAAYAGSTHRLSLVGVIAAAAFGAIAGDNLGYWIGREGGFRLLCRYGKFVRLTEVRLKVGEYLFWKHGVKIVFFSRFVAVLRELAALLAGANRMTWPHFLLANASGAVVWSTLYGTLAFVLGSRAGSLLEQAGRWLAVGAAIAVVIGILVIRQNEKRLEQIAQRTFPGPLGSKPRREMT